MKCQYEECKGFISQSYKCGLCEKYTCSKCYLPETEGHQCKETDVASAKLIKEETRPCPSCSTRIYKIGGCDQMWCTDCRTAFSWNTGKVVNGVIHNPHYYEYLRNTQGFVPRADEPHDLCTEFPHHEHLVELYHKLRYTFKIKSIKWVEHHLSELYRFIMEVIDTHNILNEEITHEDGDRFVILLKHNRILYLLKRINSTKFEHDAFMYHQRSIQHRRFLELVTMLRQVLIDIYVKYYASIIDMIKEKQQEDIFGRLCKKVIALYEETFKLIEYFNVQHTLNPYTKIYSDHYGIVIENISQTEEGKSRKKSTIIPNILDFNLHVTYKLQFRYVKNYNESSS